MVHYAGDMINTLIATMVLAAATAMDGTLPLYPHGVPAPAFPNVPASELAHGTEYQQTTSDSVQTVDQWYRANAPKSCSRKIVQGAVKAVIYSCPGGRIFIQKHGGGTLVSFVIRGDMDTP